MMPSAATLTLCLAACGGGDAPAPAEVLDIEAELSEAIATVVKVRWETDTLVSGKVEFQVAGETLRATPVGEPTTSHEALLWGLPASTVVSYRPVLVEDEGQWPGEWSSIETGPLPSGLPSLTRAGEDAGVFLAVPVLGGVTAATILDPEGRFVWYHFEDRDLDVYRVRLARDGESVIYNAASVSGDPADDSELVRISIDGTRQETIPVPLLAHDFVELPDGTIGAIQVEYREHGGEQLRGDAIVEIRPDGSIETVWTSWDCFDPDLTPGDSPSYGWTFANAIDYIEEDDSWLLGLRNLSGIVKIERATGQCSWVLGGEAGTISMEAGSSRFLHQHQFDLQGDRILVFDNEGSAAFESRVLEYSLDQEAGAARETWSYSPEPGIYTFVLGDAAFGPDDTVLVDWATAGRLERVDRDGEAIWRLETGLGFAFGFMSLEESLYR